MSGKGIEKLLAISKLPGSVTDVIIRNKVVETLGQWEGVPEWLDGLCFETTSANTRVHSGAITVIQQAFDKCLLFLACRHTYEVVATGVFYTYSSSLPGPQIPISDRFKDY